MGKRPRNLALTGGMVVLAIAVLFAGAAALPRIAWTPRPQHRIEFPLAPGIGPLEVGSIVEAAGLGDGRVVEIALARSQRDGLADDVVAVTIELDGAIELPASVVARIVKPLVGSGAAIELLGLDAAGPRLVPGAAIAAAPPREMLETMLGRQRTEALQRSIGRLGEIEAFASRLREDGAARAVAIGEAFERLQAPLGDRLAAWSRAWEPIAATPAAARTAWGGVREEWASLRERWQSAAATFERTRNSLATFGPAAGGNLREIGTLREIGGSQGEPRPQFAPIVATLERLDQRLASLFDAFGGFVVEADEQWRLSAAQLSLVGGLFAEFQSEVASDVANLVSAWLAVEFGALPTPEIERAIAQDATMQSLLRAMESLRAAELAIASLAESPAAAAAGVTVPPELPAAVEAATRDARDAARRIFERIVAPRP